MEGIRQRHSRSDAGTTSEGKVQENQSNKRTNPGCVLRENVIPKMMQPMGAAMAAGKSAGRRCSGSRIPLDIAACGSLGDLIGYETTSQCATGNTEKGSD